MQIAQTDVMAVEKLNDLDKSDCPKFVSWLKSGPINFLMLNHMSVSHLQPCPAHGALNWADVGACSQLTAIFG